MNVFSRSAQRVANDVSMHDVSSPSVNRPRPPLLFLLPASHNVLTIIYAPAKRLHRRFPRFN
ncbi:hypothetical protein AG1IA_01672 [Rhizoctonia solani AG-1 IA]|uniref:Uncharacterized protein n=1 Tax=Thanatephorus cucumeris (strain AG1-IA) TaxID=983506 RepID=L8X1Y3_THACA|nr:hypothetical protein AG1IA_01672 [Rhizoctonia solani AG-1 IA]